MASKRLCRGEGVQERRMTATQDEALRRLLYRWETAATSDRRMKRLIGVAV